MKFLNKEFSCYGNAFVIQRCRLSFEGLAYANLVICRGDSSAIDRFERFGLCADLWNNQVARSDIVFSKIRQSS